MSKGKILMIDDSAALLETTRLVLEDAGFHVASRLSAEGLGAAIAEERPDLVLLDVNMPGLSGIKVLEVAQRSDFFADFFEAAPVVLYSDIDESDLEHIAKRYGAAGYVRKGTPPDALVARLGEMIREATQGRQEK